MRGETGTETGLIEGERGERDESTCVRISLCAASASSSSILLFSWAFSRVTL